MKRLVEICRRRLRPQNGKILSFTSIFDQSIDLPVLLNPSLPWPNNESTTALLVSAFNLKLAKFRNCVLMFDSLLVAVDRRALLHLLDAYRLYPARDELSIVQHDSKIREWQCDRD